MLEKLLSSYIFESFQIPVWTLLLATICLIWMWNSGRKNENSSEKVEDQKSTELPITNENVIELHANSRQKITKKRKIKIFFGTQTGNAKMLADNLCREATERGHEAEVLDLKTYDPEDNLVTEGENGVWVVLFISTYTDGTPPEGSEWFCKWLEESSTDFRIPKALLKELHYAVFGLGNSLYTENYNAVGKKVDRFFRELSAKPILPVGLGDENVAESLKGGMEKDFTAWKKEFWKKSKKVKDNDTVVTDTCGTGKKTCDGKCKCKEDGGKCSSEEEEEEEEGEDLYETTTEEEDNAEELLNEDGDGSSLQTTNGVVDLEDLGKVMQTMKKAKVRRKKEESAQSTGEPREMVTPMLKKALEKQGYRLIGSHSGVKLCRWTKSMLRGRGGCYKHAFYGIESHRCMETTPSLACANKCVFCWRHHTNPVGTEWRWKMDDANTVFQGALDNHVGLIKQFKGVPGVKAERFAEGLEPQHCALSLVGEPIMYPEINKFIELLHGKGISSFLVTNAQFPDAISNLVPVTQLYVSIDASTKESLKKIDRPLFKDFWERFIESLKALSAKRQRTVYRLTLVKAWNTDELDNYADLVSLGKPDFIEIKGVTYCGESKASSLTMQNVPWHEEVVHFVKQLTDRLDDYEIASEHEHSNCILIANTKFKVDGEWWTWIDYPKFHQLIKGFNESQKTFSAEDYMAKTPSWAVFGAKEQGFDPVETRFFRKKQKDIGGC
ncbi:tRNA wybutosine-synthesizing protein 1 [Mytilus galloprovincialis]|uniref:S-adenosyl-L-methionine-dependent tRNA 4-demethylwyosine synthase TYW1 n=1 Tax=Mytilus galloprovincialis TaxID=29158 RepID=A0A8B6FYW2_MYTGA|nr:tRNA wybutosine-synthesizing protein 1 [Mytilus galloprovincialis]